MLQKTAENGGESNGECGDGDRGGKNLPMIPSLSTQCDDVIGMISHFGQHNRFQVYKSIHSGSTTDYGSLYLCVCELTGQIYVSYKNSILIFDKSCSELMTTIYLTRFSHWRDNKICIDGNELFVLNYEDNKIEVFSKPDLQLRRNLPFDGCPMALTIHNSVLIVVPKKGNGNSLLCAMTKYGVTLWKTRDANLKMFVDYGVSVNKQTNEIIVYTSMGRKMCSKYDFISGIQKSSFFYDTWGEISNGVLVLGPNGEHMFCVVGNNGYLEICSCSSDGKVMKIKPIDIPILPNKPDLYYPGFCAGLKGELVVFFNSKLYLLK